MKKKDLLLYSGAAELPPSDAALDRPTDAFAMATGPMVPNVMPRNRNFAYRLAVVGEAPGADEEREGVPFIGQSGRLLDRILSQAGVVRDACFVGNVCQYRPPDNDITLFSYNGNEITSGLAQLKLDLDAFAPHCTLLLGKTALQAAYGQASISDWRGSLFSGATPTFFGRKCIASYHPAACLRQYEWTPVLAFDVRKAHRESHFPELQLPTRELVVEMDADWIVSELERVERECDLIAIDIEGYVNNMSCISIATSPDYAFIVPIAHRDGTNLWKYVEEEAKIWRALSRLMANASVKKVLQNSLYDRFVLQYSYGLVVLGVVDDTMLKHWELYCELEKSLGFQASIHTNEPFYKSDRNTDDRDTFYKYCCRDSAVTHEINGKIGKYLDKPRTDNYRLNVELLNPVLYMELRGIPYDSALAAKRLVELEDVLYDYQADLDMIAGVGAKSPIDKATLLTLARSIMCYKRDPGRTLKKHENVYPRVVELLTSSSPLTKRDIGWFNAVCDIGMNLRSPRFKRYLYEELGLPTQYKIDPKTKERNVSTDYLALLKLSKISSHEAIRLALEIGSLRTRSQMLAIHADPDERIRCGYNLVGTETARLTCYTSPTGSGYNLQTIPAEDFLKPEGHPLRRGMRDLFVADCGYFMFQCDLSGADGWTVAAHLAALGDPTMLDDYKAGIKPAKVLCFMLRHGANSLSNKPRPEIKGLTGGIEKDSWDYFASKIGQHGTSYLMGAETMAKHILIQSEGKVNLSTKESADIQRLFQVRYRVKMWWDATERKLAIKPELTSASGHRRRFFGRPGKVLGEALASEPQDNTTHATKLAVRKLWNDPENRREDSSLVIEPLHTVHDALVGQFPQNRVEWAVPKIRSYFNNPITIAGISITIPFEGNYGHNWSFDKEAKVGDI